MRLALVVLLVLALPATAHAGGWATVEVDALPAGVTAGEPWRAELLVKQHGITPLNGLTPRVRIENDAGEVREFTARPAGAPGTYVADVVYPSAGEWRTRLFDGFTDAVAHRLEPVSVAGARGGGFPWPQAIAIAVVALAWLVGTVAVRDRAPARDRRPAPSGAVAGRPAPGS